MAFEFSDFEDESLGDVPEGWTEIDDGDDGDVRVTDQGAIEGNQSFEIVDRAEGIHGAYHAVDDERISFAASINREQEKEADWQGNEFIVRDSDDNVLWDYWVGSQEDPDSSEPFEIYFKEGRQLPDRDHPVGEKVGEVSEGFHNFIFEDPLNNLRLRVDEQIIHDSGNSYSGASQFEIRADDFRGLYDRGAEDASQFVVMLTEKVGLRGGVVSSGDQCVLYASNVARVQKPKEPNYDVAIVDEDLGQS